MQNSAREEKVFNTKTPLAIDPSFVFSDIRKFFIYIVIDLVY